MKLVFSIKLSVGMPSTCVHLSDCRDTILRSYGEVVRRIVYPSVESDSTIKAWAVKCQQCRRRASLTMCCCISCATFGCVEHLQAHLSNENHVFAVSTEFGHVYCALCSDFVYDRKIEKLRREAENSSRRRLGLCLKNEWNPSASESRLLRGPGSQLYYLSKNTIRGLRGLVNLGNTCFMNCIIQSLIHIPHLRDYFLTDQHICKYQLEELNGSDLDVNHCLMCELSNVFQEFYNGQIEPFIPQRMKHAEHLAGYEQHDAHEFLISALNVLHQHSESGSMKSNPSECKCIIDRLFTGRLQSDLTCMRCGRISTTVDPFWDISLELVSTNTNGHYTNERSLEDCLASYVKCETLGANAKIKCDRCGTYEAATKQLSLKTLPMVACFHLKRFEHTVLNRRKKIHSVIRFPEQIDLTPYTTAYCKAGQSNGVARENLPLDLLSRSSNRYDLLAVVNHNGSTESGHYSCFVRHHIDKWYKCNDMIIVQDELESVLGSEGYLLFYTKSFIDYD
ncbi:Ubiquitin carboxyl-terminal hydrolase [Aphelenchoides besseyi]|nr:Ubiquitin carboxyl-terminal hydrolase [Aphelenchoides besseyi]